MKALSFSQPWLWATFDPIADKSLENRDWPPPIDLIDQEIALHAAKSFDDSGSTHLWERGIATPDEYIKSAIVGTAVIDRVVTETRTLTEHQRRYYFGPIRNGKTVYGWLWRNRRLLPRPIPWDGALGLWTVPPLIEREIRAQLDGDKMGRTPAFLVPYAKALADRGCDTPREFAAKHPGEHLWFEYDGIPSCVCCGIVKPKETAKKPARPCKGVISLTTREA